MARKYNGWIISHIEGDERDKRIIEGLKRLEGEELHRVVTQLRRLGYLEDIPWTNPFW